MRDLARYMRVPRVIDLDVTAHAAEHDLITTEADHIDACASGYFVASKISNPPPDVQLMVARIGDDVAAITR
jgi:hypothetical protein